MKNFTVLSGKEIIQLSTEERIEYYKWLKEYCLSLPYDKEKFEKLEKNYVSASKIVIPLTNILYKPNIINHELIPEGNKLIFAANHLGSLDQFPIVVAIGKRPIHFMMKDTLYTAKEFYRGYLFEKWGAVPVDSKTIEGRKQAQVLFHQIIFQNSNALFFPEGSRGTKKEHSEKELPLPFQRGVIISAQVTGGTIIPISINNNYKLFKRDNIVVRINEPMIVKPSDDIDESLMELRRRIVDGIQQNQNDGYKVKRKNREGNKIYYNI